MAKPKKSALTIAARSIGVGDRAADVHVLEGRVRLIHEQVVGPGRREKEHLHAGRALELLDRAEGRELVHLDLPAPQLQLAGVLVGDVRPRHPVEVRLALLPVVRIALEAHRLPHDPLVPHERARADRVLVELRPLLAGEVLGDDPVREEGGDGEERCPRVLEVEHDRRGVGRLDVLDADIDVPPALVLGARVVERELDVRRGHRFPVREADALAQLDGVLLAVLRDLVARRQPRLQGLAVRSHRVQGLVDLLYEPDRLVLEDVRLVERRRVLLPRDPEVPTPLLLGRLGLVRARLRRRACQT